MDIEKLKIINTLAKEDTLLRVAKSLNLSQPTLSKQLASIERELDIQLIDRLGPKGYVPRPELADLARVAGDVLQSWTNGVSAIKHRVQNIIPEVCVTGPELFMRELFIPLWFRSKVSEKANLVYRRSHIEDTSRHYTLLQNHIVFTNNKNLPPHFKVKKFVEEELCIITCAQSSFTETLVSNPEQAIWVSYGPEKDLTKIFFSRLNIQVTSNVFIEDFEAILSCLIQNSKMAAVVPCFDNVKVGKDFKVTRSPRSQKAPIYLAYKSNDIIDPLVAKLFEARE